jgi:hypothetical protein
LEQVHAFEELRRGILRRKTLQRHGCHDHVQDKAMAPIKQGCASLMLRKCLDTEVSDDEIFWNPAAIL